MSQRYWNSVKNAKVRRSADCRSDHRLVIARIEIRLKKIRNSKRMSKWNGEVLLSSSEKEKFKNSLNNEILEYKGNIDEDFSQWKKLQSSITKAAEGVCGRMKYAKKTSVDN